MNYCRSVNNHWKLRNADRIFFYNKFQFTCSDVACKLCGYGSTCQGSYCLYVWVMKTAVKYHYFFTLQPTSVIAEPENIPKDINRKRVLLLFPSVYQLKQQTFTLFLIHSQTTHPPVLISFVEKQQERGCVLHLCKTKTKRKCQSQFYNWYFLINFNSVFCFLF